MRRYRLKWVSGNSRDTHEPRAPSHANSKKKTKKGSTFAKTLRALAGAAVVLVPLFVRDAGPRPIPVSVDINVSDACTAVHGQIDAEHKAAPSIDGK